MRGVLINPVELELVRIGELDSLVRRRAAPRAY